MVSNIQVEGKTLLVAPAEGFYMTEGLGTNEVRIAAVMDEQMIHSAVSILAQALT
jgi:aspartate aminotransferase